MGEAFKSVGHNSTGRFADGNHRRAAEEWNAPGLPDLLADGTDPRDPDTIYVTVKQAQGPDYCRTPQDVKFWLTAQIVNGDEGSGALRACKLLQEPVEKPWKNKAIELRFQALSASYDRLMHDPDVQLDPNMMVYIQDVITQLWVIETKCKTAGLVESRSF